MIKSKEVKVLTLSVLCCAVLTACGGGGEDSLFIGNGAKNDGAGIVGDQSGTAGGAGDSVGGEIYPTIDKFLVDITDEGQQNSPIVASVANEGSADINRRVVSSDDIRWNQPGMVSEVCGWGGDCQDENAVKFVQELRDLASKIKDEGQKQHLENWAKKIEDQYPKAGDRVIRTINNRIIIIKSLNTIDLGDEPSGDLGVAKIDKERVMKNGRPVLVDRGGSIGREFNSVLGFKKIDTTEPKHSSQPEEQTLNSFYRNPAVAGWSYQTFGYYVSTQDRPLLGKLRDQRVGYQSIGKVTETLPTQKTLTYKGITHAYYNDKQVTAHNEIKADFSNKSLTYKTTDSSILHSVEGDWHVIEKRPDLNVTASAKWTNKNRFTGDASTSGGLKGKIEGQFYGPNAEEVGGVYGLESDAGDVQYVGGFGAKR